MKANEKIKDVFKVFDKDADGWTNWSKILCCIAPSASPWSSTEIDYTLMFRFISGAELKEVMAELDEHLSQEEVSCQKIYVKIGAFFQNDENG